MSTINLCEKCGIEHSGAYATGRFCSVNCSRSYSSNMHRTEVNAKVSLTLKKRSISEVPLGVRVKVMEAARVTETMTDAAIYADMGYLSFRRLAKRLGVWNPSTASRKSTYVPLESILDGSHTKKVHGLKARMMKEGILSNRCEECGTEGWNNKPLVCELDHIDGNTTNNRRDNLRILCPNCHSQTPTFRAKNKNKGWHE